MNQGMILDDDPLHSLASQHREGVRVSLDPQRRVTLLVQLEDVVTRLWRIVVGFQDPREAP
jgi:hypothetical protein